MKLQSAILESLRTQHDRNDAARRKATPAPTSPQTFSLSRYVDVMKGIPAGKYALVRKDGGLDFLEVVKVNGRDWVNRLHGAPGSFRVERLSYQLMYFAARHLSGDLVGSAQRFGRHFAVCGRCDSPLTDPKSRALGLGPHCKKAYGI